MVTFTKGLPAWNEGSISTSRFTDCHQICQQVYWLSQIYQQIYWLSVNLLADLLNLTRSADRNVGGQYFCWQIYWTLTKLYWSDLLNVTKSASRFADSHDNSANRNVGGVSAQQIYRLSPNLPGRFTDFHTKCAGRNSAEVFTKSAEQKCTGSHHICWQIYWQSVNLTVEIMPASSLVWK